MEIDKKKIRYIMGMVDEIYNLLSKEEMTDKEELFMHEIGNDIMRTVFLHEMRLLDVADKTIGMHTYKPLSHKTEDDKKMVHFLEGYKKRVEYIADKYVDCDKDEVAVVIGGKVHKCKTIHTLLGGK